MELSVPHRNRICFIPWGKVPYKHRTGGWWIPDQVWILWNQSSAFASSSVCIKSLQWRSHSDVLSSIWSFLLTLILLTWRIWWAPNNTSKWQMRFNSACKGINGTLGNAAMLLIISFLKRALLVIQVLLRRHRTLHYIKSHLIFLTSKIAVRNRIWQQQQEQNQ
jgi:hypothetical protein